MSVKDDIRNLEQSIIRAHKAGDFNKARILGQALKTARSEPQQPQGEPIPIQQPASGVLGSVGLGAKRQAGRFGAGAEDIARLAGSFGQGEAGDLTARNELIERERAKEQEFAERTREHPIAAGVGEALPFLPLAAGGTPGAAFARGAAGGLLSFNEDPSGKVIQGLGGGAANRLGLNILGKTANRAGIDTLAGRAQKAGFNVPPEVRGPVLFSNRVQDTARFEKQMGRLSKQHRRSITSQVLTDLNQVGDRITSRTFSTAEKEAGNLFNKATSARGSVPLIGFGKRLDRFINSEEARILDDRPTIRLLNRLKDRLAGKNTDVLTPKEYQKFRSDLGKKAEAFKKKPEKRAAVYKMIEGLDDAAAVTLPPSVQQDFSRARSLWRNIQLYKPQSLYDDNGLVNARALRNNLTRKDENNFLFSRNPPSRIRELLDLNFDLPAGGNAPGIGLSTSVSASGPQTFLSGLTGVAGAPVVGSARLPTRAIEGAPLGLTVPQIRSLLSPGEEVTLDESTLPR